MSAIEAGGALPVERGLEVHDRKLQERRRIIQDVMCRFTARFPLLGYEQEWSDLQHLASDGLLQLHREVELGERDP